MGGAAVLILSRPFPFCPARGVNQVTTGMRTSEFRWMALEQEDVRKAPPGAGRKRRRGSPPSELAKRVQLSEALVLWAFKDVVVPLVSPLPGKSATRLLYDRNPTPKKHIW